VSDQTITFLVLAAVVVVVSESLDATGVTAWARQQLVARVGESRTRLLVVSASAHRCSGGSEHGTERRVRTPEAPRLAFPAMLWLQRNRYL
jgi:hypothetical protein